MTDKRTCVVAGALGIAGRGLIEHLESRSDWTVIGLSRRAPDFPTRARFVGVDLLDVEDCHRKLSGLNDVTHVFYAAFAPGASALEEVTPNVTMLQNLVTTMEAASPALRHILMIQGTKWYGHHLGPYRTPSKEDDPRHIPPNFYYDQHDWIASHQRDKRWTWSALRPHGICGFAVGSPMNHLLALALYASISRELGVPLRFPGHPGAFRTLYQFTDAHLLGRAMVWAATTPACENQALNMTNGEYERWENIWPSIAAWFGVPTGPVQTVKLSQQMADKEPLWERMREKYGLRPYRMSDLVSWNFADWSYGNPYDQMSSVAKARRSGWHETLAAESMFTALFDRLARERIIPYPKR